MAHAVIWLVLLPLDLCSLVNGPSFPTLCDCFQGLLSSALRGSLLEDTFLSLRPCFALEPLALLGLCLSSGSLLIYYNFLSLPPTGISPGGQWDDDSEGVMVTVGQTRDVTVPGSHGALVTGTAKMSPA